MTGTTSLLQIQSNDSYAVEGGSVESGDQFFITEDSIETVDILLVSAWHGTYTTTPGSTAISGQ